MNDPTRIAIGPDGTVFVIDAATAKGRTSALYIFPCGGAVPPLGLITIANPRSATFGGARLYVGDAIGLIHVLDPDQSVPEGYRKIGEGVTGLAGSIIDLAWDPCPWPSDNRPRLVAIVREEDETGVRMSLRKIDPEAGYTQVGTLATGRLDSGVDQCQWHRVELKAALPVGTKLRVQAIVSNDDKFDAASVPIENWNAWSLAGDDPDLLLPSGDAGRGRYLWLRVTFQSEGFQTPALTWIKTHYPRESYLEYLPSVYQEDDESRLFLERFLSIFQTELDGFDYLIDTIWLRLLDPASADARFLPWLAAWMALATDPTWSDATLRSMIKGAFASYRLRGTVAGLEQAIRAYGGVGWGKVIEHYKLRRWPMLSVSAPLAGGTRLWSADFYGRLRVGFHSQIANFRLTNTPEPAVEALHWGANRFSVFFPADPNRVDETRQRVWAVVDREKPAHTQAILCPVFPRFRVGVQATVGVDSVVGGFSPLVLNRSATLGYDTVLPCSAALQKVQKLGTSPRPRVGVSLKLP